MLYRSTCISRHHQLMTGQPSRLAHIVINLCTKFEVSSFQERLSVCIDEIFFWMMSNQLQLNPSKTEVLWCYICSTSASDPDWSCSCWWHICAAGTNSSRQVSLHWRRCHHECSRHCSRQSVFCSTPSNTQCASFADTHHLVDTSACTCGDKGGLLQLSSLGYFWTTVTTAAVCLQRRRSSRVLRKEVEAHNTTSPWTTLAESSGKNAVPVMCSQVSLHYRHGTVIPCWNPPLDCQHRFMSTSSECFFIDTGHIVHMMHHAGWSSISGDCCSSVECFSVVCSFCAIAAAVPPRPEDGTVSVIVLFTTVSSCVTFYNF